MIAAESVAAGDSRKGIAGGTHQKRAQARLVARALRPPPPTCFSKQEGPLATATVAEASSKDDEAASGFGKSGAPWERCRAKAVIAPPPR